MIRETGTFIFCCVSSFNLKSSSGSFLWKACELLNKK